MLSVRVQSTSTTLTLRAVVSLPQSQRRCQSQSSASSHGDQPPKQSRPQITFRQFAGRALGVSLRNVAVAISPRGIRSAYKDAPALTSMNIILLALLAVISAIAIRSYIRTFYHADFSRYPEPVANTLRRALYYTNYKPDPELALKYYKMAMAQVSEVGLDPFSDEVLGIRIQVSHWLEKINSYKAAVDVLESVLQDCKKWVAAMEQSALEGKVTEAGRYRSEAAGTKAGPESTTTVVASAAGDGAATPGHGTPTGRATEPPVEPETLWRKRQRLLAKAVGTAVKLGELYADEHVREAEKAHDHLVWAAETSLNELRRRADEGAKPGEQAWPSATELGGILSSLGRDYERRSQFQLAVPLFFRALHVCDDPCHRAVLMNNLAACFAQHPDPDANTTQTELSESVTRALLSEDQSAVPRTRTECFEAALTWAQNAYLHGKHVAGEARTAECDEACAAALCNWADVAAMLGRTELARQKYRQCIDMSRKLGLHTAVEQATSGLARLTPSPQVKN
ncbi:hypothetical protein E4U41_005782 [Claviceps citrina]|nr:hypothetical protein E4U41_005782 [Claviceps citrina]